MILPERNIERKNIQCLCFLVEIFNFLVQRLLYFTMGIDKKKNKQIEKNRISYQ